MSFPTLLRLSQKHLRKLDDGLATHYDKQITELMAQLPESDFPCPAQSAGSG